MNNKVDSSKEVRSGRKRRISRQLKVEVVLQYLRGQSLEELSRLHQLSAHEITQWRDIFLKNGEAGFAPNPKRVSREAELERIIGRQQMEIELLKKNMRPYGKTSGNS